MKQHYKIIRIRWDTYINLLEGFPAYKNESMSAYFDRVAKEVEKNGKSNR